MNKIHKLIFAIAILLTTLGVHATSYKIEAINISGSGEVTAKMGETTITTNSTLIPENTEVTLTVTPTSPGFYLKSLSYEEVTDLGQAQAPQHRADPTFQNIHTIPLSNANDHFGGNYTFRMPKNNVIITAVFGGLDSFNDSGKTFTFSISGDATYDGTVRSLIVNDGSTQLTEGLDFQITAMTLNGSSTGTDYTIQKAGNYVVTVQGIGKYQDSKESGTLTINHKALKITAWNQSYQYAIGRTISTGTGYVTIDATDGLVAGDNLTGITLTQSTTGATGDTPGTITPSAATTTNGIENYAVTYVAGSLTITQRPYNANNFTITQTFTWVNYSANTEQIPGITVSDGTTELEENVDYVLSYTSHFFSGTAITDFSKPDIYYVTITFQGNYSGSAQVEYQIRKKLELSSVTKWNTYYDLDYDMEVVKDNSATPQDFKAYTVSGISETAVILTEQNYIKKATPMMLNKRGTTCQFYPPLVKDVGGTNWGTPDAYLKGVTVAKTIEDIQAENSGKDIWILVNDKFVRTKSGTLNAGRCYLALPSGSYINPAFAIEMTLTGIDEPVNIFNDLEYGVWYTIDGRRLQGVPAQKGIYIKNGKKLIIK